MNIWDCMGININSAITPADGVRGATAQAFQHGRGRRTFIVSPNGRLTIARREAAAQCRRDGIKKSNKSPRGTAELVRNDDGT